MLRVDAGPKGGGGPTMRVDSYVLLMTSALIGLVVLAMTLADY